MAFRWHLVLPALPFPLNLILDPTPTRLKQVEWFPQRSTLAILPITLIPDIPWALPTGVSCPIPPSFLLTHCQKPLFLYLVIRLSKK